ncbi:MAG: hypothetical protein COX48_04405 [bacterium (Candidatus Stahlbacteria) CG23_combo_of_CG06-09_8_20_14_all_34_7]|nr:MAG: hypothetical protein COX48_04405 [bacterium (Candidatus Stahlbacteria) CG23_combo_of_CG06-09_8_20_14_all_34_7]
MHELSIAKTLLKEIEKIIDGKKPEKILIKVGAASGISIDFLRHSFVEHIFPEKNWQNVNLILESEEPSLYCPNCKKEIKDLNTLSCPFCQSDDMIILSGDKVYIKKIQTAEDIA